MKKSSIIPIPVNKTLKKLGQDLRQARIKRNLTMALVEERAGITHVTLTNVEKGLPTVSIGTYAKVIFVLGLIDNLYNLIDSNKDIAGKIYDEQNLPKRVRYKKSSFISEDKYKPI